MGDNGAGKTNLLEAIHVATQGFSPRTRSDAQLIRFGEDAGRIALRGRRGSTALTVELTLRAKEGKRAVLNGARLAAAEQLRREGATLVFTPDRLAVVKGGPAARRAYLDRVVGRLWPSRAQLPVEYASTLAQRNAALRRLSLGLSDRASLAPWTDRLATQGARLVEARAETVASLEPAFRERASELGLPGGRLEYAADPPTVAVLEARLDRDLERGATGLGPHLDDVVIASGERELRSFGSQGEQRLAVLALLLGEAELLAARDLRPLLLLDDVLSELDQGRRRVLADRIGGMGQTVITATSASALPAEPAQIVDVVPGKASSR